MERLRKIELLAPARNLETAIAAIDYGADAVYVGASRFGARHAATNSADDIARIVEYARRYGVRVYAALNTLLFDGELEAAREQAQEVIDAGVDALIVQDMAYLEMGLEGVELHASTQTFNASPEKVRFLQECGFTRVILERNLSLGQIKEIRAGASVDLECFVHGAICVCHSGRCFMSRTMSERSGNRGECSQPCRLSYDLVDEAGRVLVKGKHLLSVLDMDLSARIGEMIDAGVCSFKIEGRLKDTEYVKNSVAFYRRRIDEEIAKRQGFVRSSSGETVVDFEPDLSKAFTRGGTEYFFDGVRRGVASFDTPKARGALVGVVAASGGGWFELAKRCGLNAGDGVCFMAGGELVGANVNCVDGRRVVIQKDVAAPIGVEVYRNYDHQFSMLLQKSRTRRVVPAAADVAVTLSGIKLTVRDADRVVATVEYDEAFDVAANPERMLETLKAQVAKSGDTIFDVRSVAVEVGGDMAFVPVSVINALRREALERLLAERLAIVPERDLRGISADVKYPADRVDGSENITNGMAERFYASRGVADIERGLDLRSNLVGCEVMRTPYCIRREIGECLKKRPKSAGKLYLQRGARRYELVFDCNNCMMSVVYRGENG